VALYIQASNGVQSPSGLCPCGTFVGIIKEKLNQNAQNEQLLNHG